jgi:two-component system sensor histidine kinase DesK
MAWITTFDQDEAQQPRRLIAHAGVGLGLLYLIGPISDLAQSSLSPPLLALIWIGLAAFVAVYWSLLPPAPWLVRRGYRWILAMLALLPLIAGLLLILGAPSSFVALFVYVVAASSILLPPRPALGVIAATAIGVAIGGAATGAKGSDIGVWVLTIVSIGAIMAAFGRIVRGNRELRAAREQLATLAVTDERLRIARDLHDLLGHSLSVIALKSELAMKLAHRDAERTAAELADIESVARQALAEVRDAVQGYRSLGLAEALDGARAALAAAGIEYQLQDGHVALPPDIEAVLAWAVREGTTNVVRHSRADRCSIRVHTNRDTAEVEIEDNGTTPSTSPQVGSGLAGLRERVRAARGTIEAGPGSGGGFRLHVTIPLTEP